MFQRFHQIFNIIKSSKVKKRAHVYKMNISNLFIIGRKAKREYISKFLNNLWKLKFMNFLNYVQLNRYV